MLLICLCMYREDGEFLQYCSLLLEVVISFCLA